jgi:ankyrin repeat protein
MKKIQPFRFFLIFGIISLLSSCFDKERQVDRNKLLGIDYRLFQKTPAWDLAKAVWEEDITSIKKIVAAEKVNIDYQEPRFGKTLLMLAVANEQYSSTKALLELGADPNKHDNYDGTSPIIDAAKINSSLFGGNTKFLELLLQFGGNPNDIEVGERRKGNSTRVTPLIAALQVNKISSSLSKVKLLVDAGANVNYRNEYGTTALGRAITFDDYDVALYLLGKGANYKGVFSNVEGKEYYLWDELRFKVHPLDSKDYRKKMKIVEFLKNKGIDYRKVPVPEYAIEEAKKIEPKNWKEFLKQY